jgi:hypothetical protein
MIQTYTLLVTIIGRQPADAQALADRVACHLENGSDSYDPFEAATVDAFDGDHLAARWTATRSGEAKQLHRKLRAGK